MTLAITGGEDPVLIVSNSSTLAMVRQAFSRRLISPREFMTASVWPQPTSGARINRLETIVIGCPITEPGGAGRPQRSAHRDIDKFFEAELVGVVLPQMAPHVPDNPRVIVRPP